MVKKLNTDIKNYRALIFLSMLYLTITLLAGVMVNKIVSLPLGYVQGGAIITPVWYAIADIITEVYGYQISRQILLASLACQFVFSFFCFLILHLPSPQFWHGKIDYDFVFGNTLRIYFSGVTAYLISGFVNIYFISKWKILMMGKYFWIRSIGSSTISEMIYTALIIPMISFGKLPVEKILIIVASSYGLKIVYALIASGPATLIVDFLKKIEGVDVYDTKTDYNPFLFLIKKGSETKVEGVVVGMEKFIKS